MSLEKIVAYSIEGNGIAIQEAFEKEISARVAVALDEKYKEMAKESEEDDEEDDDGEEDDEDDEDEALESVLESVFGKVGDWANEKATAFILKKLSKGPALKKFLDGMDADKKAGFVRQMTNFVNKNPNHADTPIMQRIINVANGLEEGKYGSKK